MPQFPAVVDLSGLDGTTGFKINGVAAGDISGYSVASAGDVNGDGFADVIIGAPNADPNGGNSGASYVVFGKASGFPTSFELSALNGANGFKISGESGSGGAGRAVASAGDVNNDGIDDLIVGADGGAVQSAYVVFGTRSGFAADLQLSALNGSNGFQISLTGPAAGRSVDSAGDINGDGFDDVIVGAPLGAPNSAYVVFGGASFAANLSAASLNGTNGFRLSGASDRSGWSVAGAGDVNGDGYDDVIVGAPRNAPNGYDPGASYVVFGKATGFAGSIDLAALDGWDGFKINGIATADGNGRSVAGAGDVNGDGLADLIIGANYADPVGFRNGGESYVVFGQRNVSPTLNLSSLDGSNGFRLSGTSYSGVSVSSAGDIDGDGFDDVIVGTGYGGASYVVFGKAAGFASNLNLSSLSGPDGFKLAGPSADWTGAAVASAGDLNGDGLDDFIVGAGGADPHGTDSGASYVIFGRASAPAADAIRNDTGTTAVLTVNGAVSGRIDNADLSGSDPDTDWYQLTLTANHTYRFTPNGRTGTLDVLSMRVYSDDTNAASALADNSTLLDFTPTVSGTYYLAVAAGGSGAAAKTGDYSVVLTGPGTPTVDTVADDAGTAATLAVGGSISGTIDLADLDGGVPDADWYQVTLTADHRYRFTPSSGSGTLDVLALRLYGDGTTPVTELADNGTAFDFRPTESGTYYLAVAAGGDGAASKSGDFRVSLADFGVLPDFVENDVSTIASLAVGGTISGTIDDTDFDGSPIDSDWYKLTLTVNHEYRFTVTDRTGTLDVMGLRLHTDNGGNASSLFNVNVDTPLQFSPAGSGTYYLSVSAGGSGAESKFGNFTILLEDLDAPPSDIIPDNATTTATLSVGGAISGRVDDIDMDGSAPDKDWYKVTLTADHQYRFTPGGGSGTLDVVALRLYTDSTTPASALADNDTALDFTPTTSGTYYLSVAAGGVGADSKTGTFTVTLAELIATPDTIADNVTTTGRLTPGGSVSGTVDVAGIGGVAPDKDWFKVTLQAGYNYQFSAAGTSGTLDQVAMRVYGDNATTFTAISETGTLTFTPTTSGDYYLQVAAGGAGAAGKTGDYNVSVNAGTAPAPNLSVNVSYDQSVGSLPSEFTSGIAAAVQYLQSNFNDRITINLHVGFGEADGIDMGSNLLGLSHFFLNHYDVVAIRDAYIADSKSADDANAVAHMPTSDPTGYNNYYVAQTQAVALGLALSSTPVDIYIGLSDEAGIFDYDKSNGVTAGQYDFFAVAVHEIAHAMGRSAGLGTAAYNDSGPIPNSYTILDLFRYSGGVRNLDPNQSAYFSIDGSPTNYFFNITPPGSLSDWASSVGADSFLAFSPSGQVNPVSATDLQVMDVLGWDKPIANRAPTDIVLSGLSVIENAAYGTVVGSLSASDPDPNQTFTFWLIQNPDNEFSISGVNLIVTGAIDYEEGATRVVAVRVKDGAGNNYDEVFTIAVTDVFEAPVNQAPTAVALVNALGSIAENTPVAAALKIADIVVTDDGLGTNQLALTGADSSFFEIVGNALYLKAGTLLDFESKASYAVSVQVNDASVGLTPDAVSATYTLAITNVNEAPTAVALTNPVASVAENASTAAHIKLADISVTDDALGVDALTLTGADANAFEIVGSALYLKAGTALDYESKTSYAVAVEVDDPAVGGSPDAASTVYTLAIGDVSGVTIWGTAGNDIIDATHTAPGQPLPTAEDDFIKAKAGNDWLDGSAGADKMYGGLGDDTYVVDNSGDVTSEGATDDGNDTVMSSVTRTLGANLEYLVLTGAADINGIGNALGNALIGNAGTNMLKGLGGNDYLEGGAGADKMFGGLGDDTYVVDNAGDVTSEAATDDGTDTVVSSVSRMLGNDLENLRLSGPADINGTGNALANALVGNAGANVLKGLGGDDYLDGGAGADKMLGGTGDDTYVVDDAGDVTSEGAADDGNDKVISSVARTLGANLENLTLTGDADIAGKGNTLANIVVGNSGDNVLYGLDGNDWLDGWAGADKMYGGAGNDTFVFTHVSDTGLTNATRDRIYDFEVGDRIYLQDMETETGVDFSFIDGNAFEHVAGQVRQFASGANTVVAGDVNGDAVADFSILLIGAHTLHNTDFVL